MSVLVDALLLLVNVVAWTLVVRLAGKLR